MPIDYDHLTALAKNLYETSGKDRIIITISGIPGSGKTTAAGIVGQKLIDLGIETTVVPMDGFHYYRDELDKMDDPKEAHRRRGAPFTFDAQKLVDLVKQIKLSYGKVVTAPGFDHLKKDPSPGEIVISATSKIILIEGLYLLLSDKPWNQIAPLVDEKWLLDVHESVARDRVAQRHVASKITPNIELGYQRFDDNDGPNGKYLLSHSIEPDRRIQSD